MTKTEPVDAWLAAAVAPGRRWFDLAGAAHALETVLVMARWAGLAWTAQGVMDGDRARAAGGLLAVAVAGLLALGAAWAAGEARQRGGRAVSARLRQRLAGALFPAGRRSREATPSAAALAMVDLVDDVADHAAQTEPLRRSAPAAMAAVLAVTAAVHWPAAIVLVLSTALLPVNMWLAGVIAKAGTDQQLVATQQLGAVVLDSFRGLATLRELGAVERRGRTLADAGEQLNRATMAVLRRAFLSATMMDVVITFSIAVNATYIGLSLLGYTAVPFAPPLTLFTGLLVLLVCPMFFGPLRARAAAFHQRERAATAARTIADLVGDGPTATDPSPPLRIPDAVGVSLTAVRYRYDDADEETVTADVDFLPGTWTAITGATGAGKSTLLSLIAGLRVPTGGRVRWRTAHGGCAPVLGGCAWIGQRTVLLDATVRDNIRLGCPDATEQQIRRAVDAAGLTGVLERLPGGVDARLGEGGTGMSTGEARRIAIARAFLRGTGLWLLDEPTASLDADSERDVVAALQRATEGCTVIVATHSPALGAAADTLLVLDDGVLQDADLASVA